MCLLSNFVNFYRTEENNREQNKNMEYLNRIVTYRIWNLQLLMVFFLLNKIFYFESSLTPDWDSFHFFFAFKFKYYNSFTKNLKLRWSQCSILENLLQFDLWTLDFFCLCFVLPKTKKKIPLDNVFVVFKIILTKTLLENKMKENNQNGFTWNFDLEKRFCNNFIFFFFAFFFFEKIHDFWFRLQCNGNNGDNNDGWW